MPLPTKEKRLNQNKKFNDFYLSISYMQNYGQKLKDNGEATKGDLILAHAKKLEENANQFFNNYQGNDLPSPVNFDLFKRSFVVDLHEIDSQLEIHREEWKPIVANIILALTGLGAFIVLGNALYGLYQCNKENKPATINRCLLFAETGSQQRVEIIDRELDKIELTA